MPACQPGASRGLWACRGPGLFQTFKEPEAGQGGQRAPQSLQPEPFQARNPKPPRQGPSAVAMARCWVTSKAAWCSRALHGNGSVLAFCEASLLDRVVIPSKLSIDCQRSRRDVGLLPRPLGAARLSWLSVLLCRGTSVAA